MGCHVRCSLCRTPGYALAMPVDAAIKHALALYEQAHDAGLWLLVDRYGADLRALTEIERMQAKS